MIVIDMYDGELKCHTIVLYPAEGVAVADELYNVPLEDIREIREEEEEE